MKSSAKHFGLAVGLLAR